MENQKELDLRARVQEKMATLNGYWNKTYDYMEDQLEFRDGDQWDGKVKGERETDGRPSLVLNMTKTYVNRIVNPLRMNPVGVRINTDDSDFTELLSGIVREVEHKSRAAEAYETAYENAVTCGLGWIKIGTDYENDESLEQNISIEIVRNALSVWLDPVSNRIDGSDAKYGVHVTYMDSKEAKEEYGDEAVGQGIAGIDIYEHWTVPQDSTADVTYYELENKKFKRYWLEDGTTVDEEPEFYVQMREIEEKQCKVVRFVGNKLVGEPVFLPIPFLPIIPVYGDRLSLQRSDDVRLGGLIHWLKDSQRMVNFYASNELELAALAPKSPWVIAEGQVEGYEDEWATANTKSHAFLPYKPEGLHGQMLPPPQRADNTAQTGGLIQSRMQAQQDMGKEVGIFDSMFGAVEAANEAGKTNILRQNQGELSTAHYLQNYSQSIAQAGRVIMWLLPYVGDVTRTIGMRDEEGNKNFVPMVLSEVVTKRVLQEMNLEVTSGPALEGKRREAVNAILQMGAVMPDKMGLMADLLIENLDAPGSKEIAERLKKTLPPELQDKQDGPSAEELEAQLQQSSQVIQQQTDRMGQLEGIIQQLQAQVISNEQDNKTKLATAVIKEEGAMARERIKQLGEDQRQAEAIEADAESDMLKASNEVFKANAEVEKAALESAQGSEGFVPSVKGPVSVDQAEGNQAIQDIDEIMQ